VDYDDDAKTAINDRLERRAQVDFDYSAKQPIKSWQEFFVGRCCWSINATTFMAAFFYVRTIEKQQQHQVLP
jgi:hypothetical protein